MSLSANGGGRLAPSRPFAHDDGGAARECERGLKDTRVEGRRVHAERVHAEEDAAAEERGGEGEGAKGGTRGGEGEEDVEDFLNSLL